MYIPVREHYASAPFHHVEDLNLAEQILAGRFPEYSDGQRGISQHNLPFREYLYHEKAGFSGLLPMAVPDFGGI